MKTYYLYLKYHEERRRPRAYIIANLYWKAPRGYIPIGIIEAHSMEQAIQRRLRQEQPLLPTGPSIPVEQMNLPLIGVQR